MDHLSGSFPEGMLLKSVWFPGEEGGDEVGLVGVTRIVVGKAAGPMGWYAVANVFEGDKVIRIHVLHHAATIVPATQ